MNPYYLHPNENPAFIFVSPLLDSKKFHTWSCYMEIAPIFKNKQHFIDGSLPKPPPIDPLLAPWTKCNMMVLVWVFFSLSESIAKFVFWIQTGSCWCLANPCTRFSQSDIFHISDIPEDVYSFRQGTLTVSDYFTQLKVYWD